MKLISWNVNGIRAVIRKNALGFLRDLEPDVICLQETKASPDSVDMSWAEEYHPYWNVAEKKGYAGTLTLSRLEPKKISFGMSNSGHDEEGRILTTEFEKFILANVYVPNSKRDLSRLGYREDWDRRFLAYLKKLRRTKPVIFCGDLNVAHKPVDLARPKQNVGTHGFTPEERAGFEAYVKAGFVDTFREFEKEGGHYTWWSVMTGARKRNIGWRIDYFLVSKALSPYLKKAWIQPDIMGSDHCPIGLELDL
jgi:exodeoxyribonuclease-3